MEHLGAFPSTHGLEQHGLRDLGRVYWNLSPAQLYEQAVSRGEARLSASGTLVALTGSHTGRSPNDKFTVREPGSEADVWPGARSTGPSGASSSRASSGAWPSTSPGATSSSSRATPARTPRTGCRCAW